MSCRDSDSQSQNLSGCPFGVAAGFSLRIKTKRINEASLGLSTNRRPPDSPGGLCVSCPNLFRKIHLRCLFRTRVRRVILRLRLEPRHSRPDAVRKLLNEYVVVLDRRVVSQP